MIRLVADIGGTSIRLAHSTADMPDGKDATVMDIAHMACADFAHAGDAVGQYCEQHGLHVDAVVMAAAGQINGPVVDITNNHWRFDAGQLAASIGAKSYLLINDFTAQAVAHRGLLDPAYEGGPDDYQILRVGTADYVAPLLVTGPGTGLGVAALVPSGAIDGGENSLAVIEGEGGHTSYAPRNGDEVALLAELTARDGHVSTERIVSGPGLEAVYHIQTGQDLPAPLIGAAALQGDVAACNAVNLMLQSLATAIANMALALGASGGVVIAGGIVPKLADLLPESGFFERLSDHGRRRDFIDNLPLYLALDPYAGLRGAAAAYDNRHLAPRIIRL